MRATCAFATFLAVAMSGCSLLNPPPPLRPPLPLGEKEEARTHLLQAADLAPGNAVIWDSPVLRPYGEPQKEKKKSPASEQSPGSFGNRGRLGGY